MEEITIDIEDDKQNDKQNSCNNNHLTLINEFNDFCNEMDKMVVNFNNLMTKLSVYKNRVNNIADIQNNNSNSNNNNKEVIIPINDIKETYIDEEFDKINKIKENKKEDTKEEKEKKAREKQEEKERKARERQEKKEKKEKELNEKKEKKELKEKTLLGLSQPSILPDKLCDFIGVPHKTEMMRVDLTKEIHKYIRNNKLQDTENKKNIKPNKALLELLEIEEGIELTYFNIQSYLNKLF